MLKHFKITVIAKIFVWISAFFISVHPASAAQANYEADLTNFVKVICGAETSAAEVFNEVAENCISETIKVIKNAKKSSTLPTTLAELQYFSIGIALNACTQPSPKVSDKTWGLRRIYCFHEADRILSGVKSPEKGSGTEGNHAGCFGNPDWDPSSSKFRNNKFGSGLSVLRNEYSKIAGCFEAKFKDDFNEVKAGWLTDRNLKNTELELKKFGKTLCNLDSVAVKSSPFGDILGLFQSSNLSCEKNVDAILAEAKSSGQIPDSDLETKIFQMKLTLRICSPGDEKGAISTPGAYKKNPHLVCFQTADRLLVGDQKEHYADCDKNIRNVKDLRRFYEESEKKRIFGTDETLWAAKGARLIILENLKIRINASKMAESAENSSVQCYQRKITEDRDRAEQSFAKNAADALRALGGSQN